MVVTGICHHIFECIDLCRVDVDGTENTPGMVSLIMLSTLSKSKRIFLFYLLHSLEYCILFAHTNLDNIILISLASLIDYVAYNFPSTNHYAFCYNHVRPDELYGLVISIGKATAILFL